MSENKKIPCTQENFDKVKEIFENVINEKLIDAKLDKKKICAEFEGLLKINLEIEPSIQEDQECQDLKNQIEKRQNEALRLKSNIQSSRIAYIEVVKTKIDTILEDIFPKIEMFEEEEDVEELVNEDFNTRLNILDECITNLTLQLANTNSILQSSVKKYDENAQAINNFLNNL